jgi:biotin-(acetyl-CoA carboxylase) ligase
VDRPALAASVLRALSDWYKLVPDDFGRILDEARGRSTLLGMQVALQTGGERIEGFAEDLAEDGRLLLRMADGSRQLIGAGEASVLR